MKDFRQIYRDEGPYHHQARGFRAWFLADNYARLAETCRAEHEVLDLACGEGCLAPHLGVRRLWGLDHSSEAIDWNRRLYPGAYHALLLADMRSLAEVELPRPGFHRVVCSLALMYLEPAELDTCLAEVRRLLHPGGALVFTYPTVSRFRAPSRTSAELAPGEMLAHLVTGGFRTVSIAPVCPLVPPETVDASQRVEGEEAARRVYDENRRTMTLERSYHWICQAEIP